MALAVGARLGPYEITGTLGAGGMGEVYRATDTNLKRAVAIKVLPESVASDRDRLARFQREAEVLASLNHPNIAAIYGLERSPGVSALVMELVEGPTLAGRIEQGPIPIEEALPIAKQIAEALEAAHEQGIIHRDLKPANIKLRPDGVVKVLDFGLAKALEPVSGGNANATASPTITSPAMMTGVGVLLGTAAYMSPEQARGKAVDKRSDIWAFGCVLYEMLTGKRAFDGDEVSDVLVSVLSKEPDWTRLPGHTPDSLRHLLSRLLQRDRRRRLADIADARFDLDDIGESRDARSVAGRARSSSVHKWLVLGSTAIAAASAGVIATTWLRSQASAPQVARFTITLPQDQQFSATARHFVALSPDGSRIAYLANNRLYVRAMERLEAFAVQGTEGPAALAARVPFFSPDGQWLGFWHDGQIKKVSMAGGAAIALTSAEIPTGASWSGDGTIVYGQGTGGIWQISDTGGTPVQLVRLQPGETAHGPQILSERSLLLYTLGRGIDWSKAQVVVEELNTKTRQVIVEGGADAHYLNPGYLAYVADGNVMVVPVDARTLNRTGAPVAVDAPVESSPTVCCAAHFSIAANGTLAYVPTTSLGLPATRRIVWVDRAGVETPVPLPARRYATVRLSPDGGRVAYHTVATRESGDVGRDDADIWVYEFRRGILERITSDRGRDGDPVWSPDGQHIVYYAEAGGTSGLFIQNTDGSGNAQRVTTGTHIPVDWLPDGSGLVFVDFGTAPLTPVGSSELAIVNVAGPARTKTLLEVPGRQGQARISPDGRWLAYESDETGEQNMGVFVRRFPDVNAGRWQISSGAGGKPLWSHDGRRLFYVSGQTLMSVAIRGETPVEWGTGEKLFGGEYLFSSPGQTLDAAPDGRFLVIKEDSGAPRVPDSLIVVQNWFEELKRLVPTN